VAREIDAGGTSRSLEVRVALRAIDAPEEHYAGIAEDLELDLDDPLSTLAARTEAV
jgi:hypothetical protein